MSPLKINQSFEKRGLANISSPELATYSPKGSKQFDPRPPFVTEASDTLRTNPVEPECPMGYNMRMRGTETRELFDRYANMLSARRPRNNKRKFSSRTHIAALSNHSTPSDHAAENAELRQLVLGRQFCYATLKNPFHRLTGHDSSTPTDTTPKSSGVVPPRYAAAHQVAPPSVAAIQNQTATVPGQHGVPFLTRRLDDQRNKRSRAPRRKTPADHRLRNNQLWVHGTVWHSKRVQPRIPVRILLDTGAVGGVLTCP